MKEAVEYGRFNVIVTTQLPIVLTLRAPVLIMCVRPALTGHILSSCRFDELPCHLTQVLCREATANHLVRMVERGRLQATKFSHPIPSDTASQEWIADVARLDGAIPPPSIYIHHSTESPPPVTTHRIVRDVTTAARLSPSDALIAIHLILQERSMVGLSPLDQRVMCFSERDETPRNVCQIDIPGFEGHGKVKGYGRSESEALICACLSACQLLQVNGLLEPSHFPTMYPFVPLPRAIAPQRSKKGKSNGVQTHPRRTPPFWSRSTEALGGLWYPTIVFIDGLGEEFGPLAILTRHPLPAMSGFRLFISRKPVNVQLRKCQSGQFSPRDLEQLRRATLRILRFIGNKPFVGHLEQLPYLLFPLREDAALQNYRRNSHPTQEGRPHLGNPCESELVTNIAASAFLSTTTRSTAETIEDLKDAVIQDRKIEYTKHYFVNKIREDLTPLHKPQEGEVGISLLGLPHPLMSLQRQYGYESYLEHSKARIKDFQGVKNFNQPLVEVKVVSGIVSQLDPSPKLQTAEKSVPQGNLRPSLDVRCNPNFSL